MQRRRLLPAAASKLHPPVLINAALRLSITQIDTHLDGAQKLSARDPTSPAHAAREDRDLKSNDGLAREAAEGVGVEVEYGGGS